MSTTARAFAVLSCCAGLAVFAASPAEDTVAGMPADEALRLGERMYREGILPNGEEMRSFVRGDIEVFGTMFSCESCHVRSGMGSTEGTVVTLPTAGSWLYEPLIGSDMKDLSRERMPDEFRQKPFRPAYTDRTLSRAIRLGRDPDGRLFNTVMPRYVLSSRDGEILINYLKHLSAEWSPGVDDTTIRFATVVTEGVSVADATAMMATLEAIVRDHNTQDRHEEERVRRGTWYKQEKWLPYRKFSLSRWDLTGPPETWREQLEAYYAAEPVFALLGGISDGDWGPIHEFSERERLPCLFPITEFPVISETDWYTLYFSRGLYQEGEGAARYLRRAEPEIKDAPAVQIFRDDPAGRALARGFRETRAGMRMSEPAEVMVEPGRELDAAFWTSLAQQHAGAVWLVWLEATDVAALELDQDGDRRPVIAIASASRLGGGVAALPQSVRDLTLVTVPHTLPGQMGRTRIAIERWLKIRDIPVTNYDVQAKMYFLGWTLAGVINMMRDDFYRDYFFDVMDMMRDQDYAIGVYPRLSFGPGQRYASKGCYLVQVGEGPSPEIIKRSEWVIH